MTHSLTQVSDYFCTSSITQNTSRGYETYLINCNCEILKQKFDNYLHDQVPLNNYENLFYSFNNNMIIIKLTFDYIILIIIYMIKCLSIVVIWFVLIFILYYWSFLLFICRTTLERDSIFTLFSLLNAIT